MAWPGGTRRRHEVSAPEDSLTPAECVPGAPDGGHKQSYSSPTRLHAEPYTKPPWQASSHTLQHPQLNTSRVNRSNTRPARHRSNTLTILEDEEYGEQSVSVMLDGEESEIMFVDHPADEMTVENYLTTYEPHAFVVVLSVTERASYLRAEEVLQYLWRLDVMSNKGVILVANKTDIVRARCVSSKEGSNLADSYDCKYIETSSGFNHQVDELLVGILKQIRLKTRPPETKRKRSTRRKKYRGSKTSASLKVKSFLTKVCGKEPKSKSCENLHVL
ncbi:hypothetical protein O3P69_006774 [Scylla paramamosain]|uniref:GTP-binding protein REM 1 n=1 Tax=Scylla paramamosain TaxID=85552 RepID=A0AAW0U1W1_SCYPA